MSAPRRSIATLLALGLVLAGCGGAGSGAAPSDPPSGSGGGTNDGGTSDGGDGADAEPQVLRVGTSTSITLHSLPAIAVEKGFDLDNGLELEIQAFPSGAAMVEAVASGDLQIAQAGDVPFISLSAADVPVRAIAELTDSGANYAIYLAAELAPETPEDLRGLTLGLPFGSGSSVIAEELIRVYDLGDDIELIDLAPDAIAAAYAAGDIDGFILWSPGSNRAAAQRDSVKIHDAYTSYLPWNAGEQKLGSAHTVVFARTEVLEGDPDLVERYLRTLLAARDFLYAEATADEAIGIIATALDSDEELVREALTEITFELTLDRDFLDNLTHTATSLAEAGHIVGAPDLEDRVAVEPLEGADASRQRL